MDDVRKVYLLLKHFCTEICVPCIARNFSLLSEDGRSYFLQSVWQRWVKRIVVMPAIYSICSRGAHVSNLGRLSPMPLNVYVFMPTSQKYSGIWPPNRTRPPVYIYLPSQYSSTHCKVLFCYNSVIKWLEI